MSLSPLWVQRLPVRADLAPKERTPAPVAFLPTLSAIADNPVKPRVDVGNLTPADVGGLSTESINMLVPINPKLVGQLIINAGKMRRAELPTNPMALRPMARCILLAGEKRRGQQLSDADEFFLCSYLEEIEGS